MCPVEKTGSQRYWYTCPELSSSWVPEPAVHLGLSDITATTYDVLGVSTRSPLYPGEQIPATGSWEFCFCSSQGSGVVWYKNCFLFLFPRSLISKMVTYAKTQSIYNSAWYHENLPWWLTRRKRWEGEGRGRLAGGSSLVTCNLHHTGFQEHSQENAQVMFHHQGPILLQKNSYAPTT